MSRARPAMPNPAALNLPLFNRPAPNRSAPKMALLNLALAAAVLWTALALVDSSHRCRGLYASLQTLDEQQQVMQEQWRRLLLEQSTWATPPRVEKLARQRLQMRFPGGAAWQVVSP